MENGISRQNTWGKSVPRLSVNFRHFCSCLLNNSPMATTSQKRVIIHFLSDNFNSSGCFTAMSEKG